MAARGSGNDHGYAVFIVFIPEKVPDFSVGGPEERPQLHAIQRELTLHLEELESELTRLINPKITGLGARTQPEIHSQDIRKFLLDRAEPEIPFAESSKQLFELLRTNTVRRLLFHELVGFLVRWA